MTTQDQAPNMGAIKERMHKVWTSGEYARIGNPIAIMGELLCETVDLRSGQRVLRPRIVLLLQRIRHLCARPSLQHP